MTQSRGSGSLRVRRPGPMCARYTLRKPRLADLAEALDAEVAPEDEEVYKPRYNVAPSSLGWVVVYGADRRVVRPARWNYRTACRPPPREYSKRDPPLRTISSNRSPRIAAPSSPTGFTSGLATRVRRHGFMRPTTAWCFSAVF